MRTALNALTDELRRLKTAGVKTVAVSDESILALRRLVQSRARGAAVVPMVGAGGTAVVGGGAVAVQRTVGEAPAPLPRAAAPAQGFSKPYEPPVPTFTAKATPAADVKRMPPPPTVTLPAGDKPTRWDALLALVLNDPTCKAALRPGKKVVLGVGNLDAKIMFVGEAPGAEEEIQGEPFVGPAGQLLTKMIQGMGLKRSDVYIGNIMNWRPDLPTAPGASQVGNRPPTEGEIGYCLPYLKAQIDIVNPEVLVALGGTAAQGLLGFNSFKALGDVRGRWHTFAGKPLMVTYHPSYILREPTNRKKRMIWEDLLKVMEKSALPISERQQGYFLDK